MGNLRMFLIRRQGNRVRNDQFLDVALGDAAESRIGQDGMGAAGINFLGTELFKGFGPFRQGTCVSTMSSTMMQILPSTLPIRFMTSATPGSGRLLSMMAKPHSRRLAMFRARSYPAQVRRNHPPMSSGAKPFSFNISLPGSGPRAYGPRECQRSPGSGCMEIHRHQTGDPGNGHQVRHQFGSDGFPAPGLSVLTGIAVEGNHCGNVPCAGSLEGVAHDQQFHHVVVDSRSAGGLDHKYILAPDTFIDHDLDFSVVEPVDHRVPNRSSQIGSDFTCQISWRSRRKSPCLRLFYHPTYNQYPHCFIM